MDWEDAPQRPIDAPRSSFSAEPVSDQFVLLRSCPSFAKWSPRLTDLSRPLLQHQLEQINGGPVPKHSQKLG